MYVWLLSDAQQSASHFVLCVGVMTESEWIRTGLATISIGAGVVTGFTGSAVGSPCVEGGPVDATGDHAGLHVVLPQHVGEAELILVGPLLVLRPPVVSNPNALHAVPPSDHATGPQP